MFEAHHTSPARSEEPRAKANKFVEQRREKLTSIRESGIEFPNDIRPDVHAQDRHSAHAGAQAEALSTAATSASMLPWRSALQWQLPVRASLTAIDSGPLVDRIWGMIGGSTRATGYIASPAPGGVRNPDVIETEHRGNFTMLQAHVRSMDRLELSRNSHRRTRLEAARADWIQQ